MTLQIPWCQKSRTIYSKFVSFNGGLSKLLPCNLLSISIHFNTINSKKQHVLWFQCWPDKPRRKFNKHEFMSTMGNGLKTFKYQISLDLDGNAAGTMDWIFWQTCWQSQHIAKGKLYFAWFVTQRLLKFQQCQNCFDN